MSTEEKSLSVIGQGTCRGIENVVEGEGDNNMSNDWHT